VDLLLLADAQTSGGLMAAVDPSRVDAVLVDLAGAGTPAAAVIGEVTEGEPGRVILE
jgi:selenide,water dikinase